MTWKCALAALVAAWSIQTVAATNGLLAWLKTLEAFQGSHVIQEKGWGESNPRIDSTDGRYRVRVYDDGRRIQLHVSPPWRESDTRLLSQLSFYITCGDPLDPIDTTMAKVTADSDRILEHRHDGVSRTFSWLPLESAGAYLVEYIVERPPAFRCAEADEE